MDSIEEIEIEGSSDLEVPDAKRKKVAVDRFPEPTSEEELAKVASPATPSPNAVVPKKTQTSNKWSLTTFREWMAQRNERCGEDPCPENILETQDAHSLAKWLSLYTIEVRKKDGSKYPASTIYLLLCGLQRVMRLTNTEPFDIFNKKDARFQEFHRTMESVFQALQTEGIGAESKQVKMITAEEEALLWEKGILGDSSPTALLRSVFFMNGKNFCLGGGREHRRLKLSQFTRKGDHWEYVDESKTLRCGASNVRRESKVYRQYPHPSAGHACHFYLLDLYFSKLPSCAKAKNAFYFTPFLSKPADPNQPWFAETPVGWNKLDHFMRDMSVEAGIARKTNYSLKVTGISQRNSINSPEVSTKVIESPAQPGLSDSASASELSCVSPMTPVHQRALQLSISGFSDNDGEPNQPATNYLILTPLIKNEQHTISTVSTPELTNSTSDTPPNHLEDSEVSLEFASVRKELSELRQLVLELKSKVEGFSEETGLPVPYKENLTAQEVGVLLESSGLGKYREAFETERVNGDILCELDEDILENDLGVSSRLHRIRIMKLISSLFNRN